VKANIKLALFKKVPALLLELLNRVIKMLTGNAQLPSPPVKLAEMETLAEAYATAIEDARDGSKLSKEVRNALTRQVRSVLTQTGNYVRTAANGDATILASSGFEMAKKPEPVGLPAMPKNLKVLPGTLSGTTEVRWHRTSGAFSYQVERCAGDPAVEANWSVLTISTQARFVDKGLESFKLYNYRVSAIGTAGQGQPCMYATGRAA
jgi:hypothetical protein